MPYLLIRTNQTLARERQIPLLQRCSAAVSHMLEKPEKFVMVSVDDGVPMLFGGDAAPCIYMELKSIGLPGERTAELSAQLCQLLSGELEVPESRIYIEFADAPRHMWGWNGGTF